MTNELSLPPAARTQHNQLGYSVISDSLYAQLFPGFDRAVLTPPAEQRVRDHYATYGVALPPAMPTPIECDWQLPKLQGPDLRSHFEAMAAGLGAADYDRRARALVDMELPAMPSSDTLRIQPGWTRYSSVADTNELTVASVPYPLEDDFVFDSETLVVRGNFPIIATAASSKAWYIWLHPALVSQASSKPGDEVLAYQHEFYPLGHGKLAVGHNVSFDSSRSVESHDLDTPLGADGQPLPRNVFLDTMSMHIVTSGFSGPQRWADGAKERGESVPPWAHKGCKNSLVACYNFYCWPETPLGAQDKELRMIFVEHDLPYIAERLLELLEYALLDVQYTWELFKSLYPRMRQRRPSLTSLAGLLQQSAHNLPVVDNWFEWVATVEAKLTEIELAIDKTGRDTAAQVIAEWQVLGLTIAQHNALLKVLDGFSSPATVCAQHDVSEDTLASWQKLMADPWLGHGKLDWAIKPRARKNRGQPEWYRNMPADMGRTSRLLHLLSKIEFTPADSDQAYPVFFADRKWCYLDADGRKRLVTKPETETGGAVLFAKDFAKHFESGDLRCNGPNADVISKLAGSITYWVSIRGRVMSQMLSVGKYRRKDGRVGTCNVVAPDLTPYGTVSGRGVSPLWLTVADLKAKHKHKVGVETKSRIQAPPGKTFVQADFSAQELRIGAVYADAIAAKESLSDSSQLGFIGSNMMSQGVYSGNKELGTDPHTMLAKSNGVSRDLAKTIAYALLYGAGRKTIASAIRWEDKDYPKSLIKADAVIAYRKGIKSRHSNVYTGGSDSAAFTFLAELAAQPYPQTQLLKCRLTEPLCPANCGNDFQTGRVNWGIQACARDQGDCIIVAYDWLCRKHGLNSRALWLHHDELLCIADEEDEDVCTWLLNVAHCWTWAFLHESVELYDMCTVGIFFDDSFSQKCFRKSHDTKTASVSNTNEHMPDGRLYLESDLPACNTATLALARTVCPELYTPAALATGGE